jgi:hypothetical protein
MRLTFGARDRRNQVEPDPAKIAARYGAETSMLDWRERLGLLSLRQPAGRYGGERDEVAPVNPTSYGAAAGRRLPAAYLARVSGSVAAVPRRAAVP